jgi:DNA polymerase-3 subunit delta
LYLLQDGGVVDADAIMSLVGDNARYDVYGLVDSALSGDGARSVRILQGLCAEGLAPQVVVWALARELRQLAAMKALVANGKSIQQVLSQYRIWPDARKTVVGTALARLSVTKCHAMLQQCALIDRVSKGQAAGRVWDELLQLSLQLAGTPVLPESARIAHVS